VSAPFLGVKIGTNRCSVLSSPIPSPSAHTLYKQHRQPELTSLVCGMMTYDDQHVATCEQYCSRINTVITARCYTQSAVLLGQVVRLSVCP